MRQDSAAAQERVARQDCQYGGPPARGLTSGLLAGSMTTKWTAAAQKRALMKRRGFANSRQLPQSMAPLLQSPKPVTIGPSKAEQRAEADAALAEWKRRQKEPGK